MTRFFNSSPQRVENGVVGKKRYLYNLVSVAIRICMVYGSLRYHQADYPSTTIFQIHHRSASNTMLSVRSFIYTIWSRSRVVFVWYRVLSGIITQVTHQRRYFSIHHRSASKTMLSVRSFIHTIWSRSRFVFVWYRVPAGIIKQVTRQ